MSLKDLSKEVQQVIQARGLTPSQEQLLMVANDPQPLAVQAGPGSGKTEYMVLRGIEMISKHQIDPKALCFVAFNRRAVESLKLRLYQLSKFCNINLLDIYVNTIHGFASDFLNANIDIARKRSLPIDFKPIGQELLGLIILRWIVIQSFKIWYLNKQKILLGC